MAIEVTVGPPQITINRGNTFVLSEPDGSITAYTEQGFYCRDTRYVSNHEFYVDGERWILRNSGAIAYYASRAYLINPRIRTEYGEIEPSTLSLTFTRTVSNGVVEDFEIRNYGMKRVRFNFEIALRTDFADIFEVKSKQIIRKGHVTTCWDPDSRQLVSSYEHDGFSRSLISRFVESKYLPIYSNGRISFGIDLAPRAAWRGALEHTFVESETSSRAPQRKFHAASPCSISELTCRRPGPRVVSFTSCERSLASRRMRTPALSMSIPCFRGGYPRLLCTICGSQPARPHTVLERG